MVYDFKGQVRFSEINSRGYLTEPALINYLQDAGVCHGEVGGVRHFDLQGKHIAWVLAAIQMNISSMPRFDEKIDVFTWSYAFRGCLGLRNFKVASNDGTEYVTADSQWVLMDMARQKPISVPGWIADGYGVEADSKLECEFLPRKIKKIEGGEAPREFLVDDSMLDTNKHVNNGQYFRLASEYLPEAFDTKRFRGEYKMQAHLGDALYPYVVKANNCIQVSLNDAEGKPYFVGEWYM